MHECALVEWALQQPMLVSCGICCSVKHAAPESILQRKAALQRKSLLGFSMSFPEQVHRDQYQSIAPATEDGLYLVPQVIE